MKAVVLCGGLGTRLNGLIDEVPKPMAEFNNKPILEYLVEQLSQHFNEIILLTGYKGEVIREYFDNGNKWGVCINYSNEGEPLGTGGAVKNAEELINDDFILLNGDNYHELDYKTLIENFTESGMNSMVLTPIINPRQVTVMNVEGNRVIGMKNKPSNLTSADEWMNAGILLLKKESLSLFPEGKHSMEEIVFPKLIKQGLRAEFYKDKYYIDIGTPQNYHDFKAYSEEHLMN